MGFNVVPVWNEGLGMKDQTYKYELAAETFPETVKLPHPCVADNVISTSGLGSTVISTLEVSLQAPSVPGY